MKKDFVIHISEIMSDRCSNCNREIGERCDRCGREFACGSACIECGFDNCTEMILPFTRGQQKFLEDINNVVLDVPRKDPMYGPDGLIYP